MSALRTPRHLSQRLRPLIHARTFSVMRPVLSSWSPSPAPPRLPKEEQEIFERLQQQSTGAFSTPRTSDSATGPAPSTGNAQAVGMRPQVNQSPASTSESTEQTLNARINAEGEGEELHPNVRRGAAPEFEGETNPKTGEVGGPKVEPLRWGYQGDWSYNGRVTDF